jgi:hypothetical protein
MTTAVVTIEHDDWCGHYQGRRCDCTPNVYRRHDRSDVVEAVIEAGRVTIERRNR